MYDVIIIGSGPSGYTAALYSSRAYLKTLIITGDQPGGQLTTTTEVDNFPGFEQGILGPELVDVMKKQVERFGTEIKIDTIQNVKVQILKEIPTTSRKAGLRGIHDAVIPTSSETASGQNSKSSHFFILVGQNGEYQARSVIIATGASAKRLGIPSEETFRGKGISYCATCDGFFFKNKNVVVLGGGDTAMEDATFLTKFASHVTIIHRRDEFRASPIMLDKAKKNEKISFLLNKTVEEFYGETSIQGLKLKDGKTGKVENMPIGGVFVAIGHKPSTDFLKNTVELDEKGYVLTKFPMTNDKLQTNLKEQYSKNKLKLKNPMMEMQTETSVPGIFAAGDCTDPHYRQAIVAAGQGCMAALDVQKYLEE
jgi:thioredoxin reductase (NADPH)